MYDPPNRTMSTLNEMCEYLYFSLVIMNTGLQKLAQKSKKI